MMLHIIEGLSQKKAASMLLFCSSQPFITGLPCSCKQHSSASGRDMDMRHRLTAGASQMWDHPRQQLQSRSTCQAYWFTSMFGQGYWCWSGSDNQKFIAWYFDHQRFRNHLCILRWFKSCFPAIFSTDFINFIPTRSCISLSRQSPTLLKTPETGCAFCFQSDKEAPQSLSYMADPRISFILRLFLAYPFPEPPNTPSLIFCVSLTISANGYWHSFCKVCGRMLNTFPSSLLPALRAL